jgi:hypothetical protein
LLREHEHLVSCAFYRDSPDETQTDVNGRRILNWLEPLSLPETSSLGVNGVATTTGSACHSGRIELSPVLEAMGVKPEVGMGAVRFSLGRGTARDEIDIVVERLTDILAPAG